MKFLILNSSKLKSFSSNFKSQNFRFFLKSFSFSKYSSSSSSFLKSSSFSSFLKSSFKICKYSFKTKKLNSFKTFSPSFSPSLRPLFQSSQSFCSSKSNQTLLSLTPRCEERLNHLLNQIPKNETSSANLRIEVEGGGCSGFQYKFSVERQAPNAEEDLVVEQNGARVVMDRTSAEYLKGCTLDYKTELIRSAFVVVGNPNAETTCSCGASFKAK